MEASPHIQRSGPGRQRPSSGDVIAQGNADPFREAGDAFWRSGNRDAAAKNYQALLKLQPCDPAALCRVAVATCLEQGNSNEAVALLLRAAGQPDPPQEVLVWLGYARLAAGDAEKALASLRVATLHPEKTMESEVHLYWALSLMDLGDEVEAAAQFAIAARGHSALRRALAEGHVGPMCLAADLPGASRHLRIHLEALMRQSPACAKLMRGSASRGSTPPHGVGPLTSVGSRVGESTAGAAMKAVTPLPSVAPKGVSLQMGTSPVRTSLGGPRGASPRGNSILPTTSPRGSVPASPSAASLQGCAPRSSTPPPNGGVKPFVQQRLLTPMSGGATPASPRSAGATCTSPRTSLQAGSQQINDVARRGNTPPASPGMCTRSVTSPGGSTHGGPVLARPATSPPDEGAPSSPQDWRASLRQDQAIEVYSRSGSTWMPGSIVQLTPEMVKVKYMVDGKWCEKVILRSSETIRVPPRSVACSSPKPQQFLTAVAHQPNSASDGACQQQRQLPSTPLACAASAASAVQPRTASPCNGTVATTARPRTASPRAVPSRTLSPRAVSPRAVPRQPEPLQAQDLSFGLALGSGTFATVYRGAYRGEEVAIKKLHIQDGQVTPQQLEEFQKEIANLMEFRHPRLIRFIGVAVVSPSLCIVTEFMPNGSLFDVLHKRKEKLEFSKRAQISAQAAEGIAFLHGSSPPFVHRDVKSLNVVMDHGLNAKLCDFGLTQSMEKTHISRREHDHGGSPRYMAPELFDARLKINEKVDVWALGCLVVETFTGHMPHEECRQIQQVMFKSLVDKVGPFGDLRWEGVDARVIALSDSCLYFEPRERADAQTVLHGLRSLCPPVLVP